MSPKPHAGYYTAPTLRPESYTLFCHNSPDSVQGSLVRHGATGPAATSGGEQEAVGRHRYTRRLHELNQLAEGIGLGF